MPTPPTTTYRSIRTTATCLTSTNKTLERPHHSGSLSWPLDRGRAHSFMHRDRFENKAICNEQSPSTESRPQHRPTLDLGGGLVPRSASRGLLLFTANDSLRRLTQANGERSHNQPSTSSWRTTDTSSRYYNCSICGKLINCADRYKHMESVYCKPAQNEVDISAPTVSPPPTYLPPVDLPLVNFPPLDHYLASTTDAAPARVSRDSSSPHRPARTREGTSANGPHSIYFNPFTHPELPLEVRSIHHVPTASRVPSHTEPHVVCDLPESESLLFRTEHGDETARRDV